MVLVSTLDCGRKLSKVNVPTSSGRNECPLKYKRPLKVTYHLIGTVSIYTSSNPLTMSLGRPAVHDICPGRTDRYVIMLKMPTGVASSK